MENKRRSKSKELDNRGKCNDKSESKDRSKSWERQENVLIVGKEFQKKKKKMIFPVNVVCYL
jgi:hypothetical protein